MWINSATRLFKVIEIDDKAAGRVEEMRLVSVEQ